jgi:hypothetical protein
VVVDAEGGLCDAGSRCDTATSRLTNAGIKGEKEGASGVQVSFQTGGVKHRAAGGTSDVADLGHYSSKVDLRHVGDVGVHGLMRVRLHDSWSFQLPSCSHAFR